MLSTYPTDGAEVIIPPELRLKEPSRNHPKHHREGSDHQAQTGHDDQFFLRTGIRGPALRHDDPDEQTLDQQEDEGRFYRGGS
jgi:hypothetical protein